MVHNGMTLQQLRTAPGALSRRSLCRRDAKSLGSIAVRCARAADIAIPVNAKIQAAPHGSLTFLAKSSKSLREARHLSCRLSAIVDYVVVHGPDLGDDLEVLECKTLTLVDRKRDFRLYRVEKGST